MLAVLILKIIYKYKAKVKHNEDLELSHIKKVTFLNFYTEYNEWYIIPNISISFNCGIDVTFKWLKFNYSCYWTAITYKEENDYAAFIKNKNNEK